jgi:hypothetical protein
MRDVAIIVGIAVLIGLGVWLVGSIVLRIAGVLIVLAGLISAVTGSIVGLVAAALGLLVWLAGHWLYGFRHHRFVSPLARRAFKTTPLRRIDPTRGWGVPTAAVPAERDRR